LVLPLLSAGEYGAGTYSSGVYTVGEVSVTTPPSGGGSSGGTTSCEYDWVCTNWFPEECPESEVQERICVNKGTCTGILEMPNQTQTCTYEGPTEPLFDIFLTIPQTYTKICAGKNIKVYIQLENYGKIELLDAFMTYWILNENNTLIAEIKDTRAVKDKLNFEAEIKIPTQISPGIYRVYSEITYSGNKTAIAGESFEVIEGISCTLEDNTPLYALILFIGFALSSFVILVIKKIKKKKSEKKEILSKIKEKRVVPKPKIKLKLNSIKQFETKKEALTPPKKRKKKVSVQKSKKSLETKTEAKKQMFEKLVEDTVKLKKQKKE